MVLSPGWISGECFISRPLSRPGEVRGPPRTQRQPRAIHAQPGPGCGNVLQTSLGGCHAGLGRNWFFEFLILRDFSGFVSLCSRQTCWTCPGPGGGPAQPGGAGSGQGAGPAVALTSPVLMCSWLGCLPRASASASAKGAGGGGERAGGRPEGPVAKIKQENTGRELDLGLARESLCGCAPSSVPARESLFPQERLDVPKSQRRGETVLRRGCEALGVVSGGSRTEMQSSCLGLAANQLRFLDLKPLESNGLASNPGAATAASPSWLWFSVLIIGKRLHSCYTIPGKMNHNV